MDELEENMPKVYISSGMQALFSLVGVLGNGLVLYGFANSKPRLTSTIFILTLACIDFLSCLLTIPANITMELRMFRVSSDIACKLYHFLLTTTIPLSAFVMVAVAFDRYFCICHPLKRIMTRQRAGVIVFSLSMFALIIGVISCMNYGIQSLNEIFSNSPDPCQRNMSETEQLRMTLSEFTNNTYNNNCMYDSELFCSELNDPFFGRSFQYVFGKIYSSFYAICCILVIVLYAIIYRFILARRKRRLRTESIQCCSFNKSPLCDTDNTEITYMSQDISQVPANNADINSQQRSSLLKQEPSSINAELSAINRQKEEKIRINNIKTALMLSVVALVFIVAFLPAWLMKLQLIRENIIVFNSYFIYNVANPFIYAFMNPEFQQKISIIIRDMKKRWSSS